MYQVLLIERSATFRHIIRKLLSNNGFQVNTAESFQKGLALLANEALYDAIVVGWPERTDPCADEMLVYLNEALHGTPKLIFSEDGDPAKLDWMSKNPFTQVLPKSGHHDACSLLTTLIARRQDQTEPNPKQREKQASRIMIVDDSPSARVNFRRLLEAEGYSVETASSVSEAMDLALSKPFDIAIIDYYMPEANGDVLVTQLKREARTKDIVSCILTGTYSDQVIKDCLDAGAVECMFKSEASELFVTRVRSLSRAVMDKRAIEHERRYLKNILSSVGDGVYGVDKEGNIEFINHAVCRLLGYPSANAVVGQKAHHIFHYAGEDGVPVVQAQCQLTRSYRQGSYLTNWRTVFWNKAGVAVHVECTVFPIVNEGECRGSVVAFRDISDRKSFEEELRWQATHDPLTKLPNRSYFEDQLEQEINRLRRSNDCSALLFIDVDRFKYINDTAGHAVGDQILIDVCERLRSRLRSADVLARISGDEFAIILRSVEPEHEQVFRTADMFRRVVEEREFYCLGKIYNITLTIGVDILDKNRRSAGEAMSNADIACYISKSGGRNQTHIFSSEEDSKAAMNMELGWSTRLRNALKNNHFVLSYQPIVSMHNVRYREPKIPKALFWDNDHVNYEVLLRLQDSDGGYIMPSAFLPTAERFDLITEIDKWVIDQAFRTLSEQHAQGHAVNFSINLSAQALSDHNLAAYIKHCQEQYQLDSSRVMFEITETGALTNISAAKALIAELRERGFRFALDDFGSGFSSFTHLKHLDVDVIKIDGQFVRGAIDNAVDKAVIFAVTEIAHTLGKRTIAEYVENVDILSALLSAGVDYVQGFHVGKPFFGLNRERVQEMQTLVATGSFYPRELLAH